MSGAGQALSTLARPVVDGAKGTVHFARATTELSRSTFGRVILVAGAIVLSVPATDLLVEGYRSGADGVWQVIHWLPLSVCLFLLAMALRGWLKQRAQERRRRVRLLVLAGLAVVAAMGLILGVVLLLRRRRAEEDDGAPPDPASVEALCERER